MKVTKIREGKYWRVYFYVPQPEGKPRKVSKRIPVSRKNAAAEAEALRKRWHNELQAVGTAGVLPSSVINDVRAAKGILIDYPGVTLRDAAEFYTRHHVARAERPTIGEVVKRYLAAEKGRGLDDKTYNQYATRGNALANKFKGRLVVDFHGTEIVDWVTNLGKAPVTTWGYFGCAERIFDFCVGQGWLRKSPITDEDKKRMPLKKKVTAPSILSGDQGQALFAAIPKEHKAMFAILYFTGMRQEMGRDLKWADVDLENRMIHVPAYADKKNRERFIEGMPDRLWEILENLPEEPKDTAIVPSPRRFKTIMTAARKAAKIDPWPTNALRRSFASHHLHYKTTSGSKDRLSQTLLIMCHQESPTVFWNFYYRRSTAAEAQKYFDVSP